MSHSCSSADHSNINQEINRSNLLSTILITIIQFNGLIKMISVIVVSFNLFLLREFKSAKQVQKEF